MVKSEERRELPQGCLGQSLSHTQWGFGCFKQVCLSGLRSDKAFYTESGTTSNSETAFAVSADDNLAPVVHILSLSSVTWYRTKRSYALQSTVGLVSHWLCVRLWHIQLQAQKLTRGR